MIVIGVRVESIAWLLFVSNMYIIVYNKARGLSDAGIGV